MSVVDVGGSDWVCRERARRQSNLDNDEPTTITVYRQSATDSERDRETDRQRLAAARADIYPSPGHLPPPLVLSRVHSLRTETPSQSHLVLCCTLCFTLSL